MWRPLRKLHIKKLGPKFSSKASKVHSKVSNLVQTGLRNLGWSEISVFLMTVTHCMCPHTTIYTDTRSACSAASSIRCSHYLMWPQRHHRSLTKKKIVQLRRIVQLTDTRNWKRKAKSLGYQEREKDRERETRTMRDRDRKRREGGRRGRILTPQQGRRFKVETVLKHFRGWSNERKWIWNKIGEPQVSLLSMDGKAEYPHSLTCDLCVLV